MSSRVYIGQLSSHARESDVERFFKGFGRIRELVLKNGYGFVEFEDYQDADDAVYELNDREICGERVRIEHARGKPRERDFRRERYPPRRGRGGGGGGGAGGGGGGGGGGRDKYGPPSRTEYRLIVENLSSRVSWQDLKDHMRQAGEVTYADANKQRMNEGIVEFATYHDMKSALDKLDDSDINGRRVRLIEDKPRKRRRSRSSSDSRSRSRSRSRGRKRSRSRSRSRDRSRSRSRSRGRDRSRSRSRSRSRGRDRSRSRSLSRGRDRSGSRSRNRSRSRSRKRSRSSSSSGKKGSKSRSRSRTRSPEKMSPGKPEANGTPPSDG